MPWRTLLWRSVAGCSPELAQSKPRGFKATEVQVLNLQSFGYGGGEVFEFIWEFVYEGIGVLAEEDAPAVVCRGDRRFERFPAYGCLRLAFWFLEVLTCELMFLVVA